MHDDAENVEELRELPLCHVLLPVSLGEEVHDVDGEVELVDVVHDGVQLKVLEVEQRQHVLVQREHRVLAEEGGAVHCEHEYGRVGTELDRGLHGGRVRDVGEGDDGVDQVLHATHLRQLVDPLGDGPGDLRIGEQLLDEFLVWVGGLAVTFARHPVERDRLADLIASDHQTLGDLVIRHRVHGLDDNIHTRPLEVLEVGEGGLVLVARQQLGRVLKWVYPRVHLVELFKSGAHRLVQRLPQVPAELEVGLLLVVVEHMRIIMRLHEQVGDEADEGWAVGGNELLVEGATEFLDGLLFMLVDVLDLDNLVRVAGTDGTVLPQGIRGEAKLVALLRHVHVVADVDDPRRLGRGRLVLVFLHVVEATFLEQALLFLIHSAFN